MRLLLAVGLGSACLLCGCRHGAGRPASAGLAGDVEVVEEFWPDGTLRLRRDVCTSSDGPLVNHGTYTRWYDNGQKEYQATYVRGKLHGLETQWHRNGQKHTEQHYEHGLRHGVRLSWDAAGRKRKEEHYIRDKPDGTWTVWAADGRIKWQGTFHRGEPQP